MRPLVTFLCLVLCAATMLAPFARAHAHLGHDVGATELHAGHQHDFDHDGMGHVDDDHGEVVYLSGGVPQQDGGNLSSIPWLPLLYVVAVLRLADPLLRRIYIPLRREARLPSQHPPWPPPLRGPPLSI